ncbi:hypothetical protein [Geotalea sp. SG265]|uniref:hypothetical protein n=1 Tax=Geotalea sp. SG265 TaxID=2922867 RepID=UPI001FB048B2|nr:hypothetical protein [Geotalea sp. SG265]
MGKLIFCFIFVVVTSSANAAEVSSYINIGGLRLKDFSNGKPVARETGPVVALGVSSRIPVSEHLDLDLKAEGQVGETDYFSYQKYSTEKTTHYGFKLESLAVVPLTLGAVHLDPVAGAGGMFWGRSNAARNHAEGYGVAGLNIGTALPKGQDLYMLGLAVIQAISGTTAQPRVEAGVKTPGYLFNINYEKVRFKDADGSQFGICFGKAF